MRSLDKCSCYYSTVLQHILKIHQITVMHVLCEIVSVVKMYYSFIMGFYDFLWKQQSVGKIL